MTHFIIADSRKSVEKTLLKELPKSDVRKILADTQAAYKEMSSDMPDIGRGSNSLSAILYWSVWSLALYFIMRKRNCTDDWIGNLILKANKLQTDSLSSYVKRNMKERMFKDAQKARMRKWCALSAKREYPENWVADFVEEDGFDYGIDYHECAICKLYAKHGALGLVPYICKTDFNLANSVGYTLQRTGTIADGNQKCDFRYRKM